MEPRAWMRGEKGLQALEWIALALGALALPAALAFGLRRTETGPGEALSAAVSAWFRCLIGQGDCPLTAVGLEKAGPCWTQPIGCLARWGDCLLQGACEGADPTDLLGLLPWLAVVGIPAGGVVFALLPPWVRRRRWAWPRLPLPPPRVPPGSSETSPSGPGRPLWQRALTILPVLMGFLVIDGTLAALTDANSMALIGAPDPFSKGVLILNELILIGADVLIAWAHLSYAHWVVTGRPIRSGEDLWDWRLRP
jgi:hypothetical protein